MLNTFLFIETSSLSNPMVLILVIIMFILLMAIALLANVVMGAASWFHQQEKEKEKEAAKKSNAAGITAIMVGLLLLSAPVFAQDTKAPVPAATTSFGLEGLSGTAFYLVTGVIAIELLVLFFLVYQLKVFLRKEKAAVATGEAKAPALQRWAMLWAKFNRFRPVAQEADLDLGHDYDGIRELDNRLPPWWLYGFYATILVGVVYLYRFHVSHTAPLSGEEYRIAMQDAEIQKAAYLKKAANNIDENTVTLVTEATALTDGKEIFEKNCSPCHGKGGEGIVGPNLTDDYWLHGGSVKDIFKTIKYGWPEKGMKAWKEDLSPSQIARLTGFIKSIHGSNPPNGKEKQGDLFRDAVSLK